VTQANYDSSQVDVVVAGIPLGAGAGRGKDEFVAVKYDSPLWTWTKGVDGKGCRNKTNDLSAVVTVTLLQSSAQNGLLSALAILDYKAPNGAGCGPFLIKDNNGGTMYAGDSCWIQKIPDNGYRAEIGEVAWEIRVATLVPMIAGM
jgi:hypothetical protein